MKKIILSLIILLSTSCTSTNQNNVEIKNNTQLFKSSKIQKQNYNQPEIKAASTKSVKIKNINNVKHIKYIDLSDKNEFNKSTPQIIKYNGSYYYTKEQSQFKKDITKENISEPKKIGVRSITKPHLQMNKDELDLQKEIKTAIIKTQKATPAIKNNKVKSIVKTHKVKDSPIKNNRILAKTIYFRNGSSRLTTSEINSIKEISGLCKKNNCRLEIEGHSSSFTNTKDSIASKIINLKFASKRAEKVLQQTMKFGLKNTKIKSFGDSNPISKTNASLNRRVEIFIVY